MPTVSLAEAAKLALDELVAGVIENVITVNRFFEVLPFDMMDGNALAYNRENVLGDVQTLAVAGTITAKAAATFTKVTSALTTIIGDAMVNGLIQATLSSDGNDQKAIQIASKAKSVGRKYQDNFMNGTGAPDVVGITSLVAVGQTIIQDTAGVTTDGGVLSFAKLDELIDLVTDKDGSVDYMLMHARTIRSYYALLRALGGAGIGEVVTLPSGAQVPGYRGIPIFRNDYMATNEVQGALSSACSVFAGTLDDGSRSHGIAGLAARSNSGIQVVEVGEAEATDDSITRVKWYCGLANFSEKGLARLKGVSN